MLCGNQPAYISVIHRRCTPLGRRGGCTRKKVKGRGSAKEKTKSKSKARAQRNLTGHSISAGGRAPHGTMVSSRKTWRREHHRTRFPNNPRAPEGRRFHSR